MKITDIKTIVVDCFRTNWAFVKVYTDGGIDGYRVKPQVRAGFGAALGA